MGLTEQTGTAGRWQQRACKASAAATAGAPHRGVREGATSRKELETHRPMGLTEQTGTAGRWQQWACKSSTAATAGAPHRGVREGATSSKELETHRPMGLTEQSGTAGRWQQRACKTSTTATAGCAPFSQNEIGSLHICPTPENRIFAATGAQHS